MRPFEDNKFHEIDIKFMCCTVRLIQIERTNERRHNDGTRSAVHRPFECRPSAWLFLFSQHASWNITERARATESEEKNV